MTEKRTWVGPSAPERLNILRNTRTIAIVGMSDKISRASYFVATYLQSASPYKLYFVNPILAAKGKLVLGSWSEEAAAIGEAAGLNVVMDKCVKIEHARFHGGLHLAGFNTGVISSKRQVLSK